VILTTREARIVSMIVQGKSRKEISEALDISIKTVDGHVRNAYRKLGVKRASEATFKWCSKTFSPQIMRQLQSSIDQLPVGMQNLSGER